MLKVWAKIYQLTGWYCPLARLQEYKALKVWADSSLGYREIERNGAVAVFVFIGGWQAYHGFTRTYRIAKGKRRYK